MAPTSRIYLTRHAEAEHNATGDSMIADALLTKLGEQQAARLGQVTPELQTKVELVVSSPLRRTLQTTAAGYKDAITRLGGHAKVLCLPQLQECNAVPCDTGSSRQVLEAQAPFAVFNLEHLTPDWTSKQDFYAPDPASLESRAQWVRQFLRERPEQHIAVVAHGDFLRRLTREPDSYWANAEVREFVFAPDAVTTDECPLMFVRGWEQGDWRDEPSVSAAAAGAAPAVPAAPVTSGAAAADPAASRLSDMEERVKQMYVPLLTLAKHPSSHSRTSCRSSIACSPRPSASKQISSRAPQTHRSSTCSDTYIIYRVAPHQNYRG